MLKNLSLFLCFLTFACYAQSYYRWVDKNGTVNYSDKPPAEEYQAEKLSLPATTISQDVTTNTNKTTVSKSTNTATQPNDKKTQTPKASKIAILSPSNEETIRSNQGIISVKLTINSPLAEGQYVQLLLNGKKLKKQNELTFKLENIDRGSHHLRALLLENNKALASSKEIVVFLHRAKKPTQN